MNATEEYLVLGKWGRIHRLCDDLKQSFNKSGKGLFMKAHMYSTYVWSVGTKPFLTKAVTPQKRRILNVFRAIETKHGRLFRKYSEGIAEDVNMPLQTPADEDRLFNHLSSLTSFATKHHRPKNKRWSFDQSAEIPKPGGWFSWNNAAHENIPEYRASKMLYEHYLGNVDDPNDSTIDFDCLQKASNAKSAAGHMRSLKAATGGMPLAYSLMSDTLLLVVKIMYIASVNCWSYYTWMVTHVTTPRHELKHLLKSASPVYREAHLRATLSESFSDASALEYMQVPMGQGKVQGWVTALVWAIVSHQHWSIQVRHCRVPECYIEIFDPRPEVNQATADRMGANWRTWMRLEQLRFTHTYIDLLLDDLDRGAPARVLHILFERDRFKADSVDGRKFLRGSLETMPDEKPVEELHRKIKRDSKKKANRKQRGARIQNAVLDSNILESRSINHKAAVDKAFFVNAYRTTTPSAQTKYFHAKRHKMHKSLSQIMGKKVWKTVTVDCLRRSAAAWRWLEVIASGHKGHHLVDAALFSRWFTSEILIQQGDDAVFASLGNYSWGVLVLPTKEHKEDGITYYLVDCEATACMVHVTDPDGWKLIPHVPSRCSRGLAFETTGDATTLTRVQLLSTEVGLVREDFLRLGSHWRLEGLDTNTAKIDLVRAVATFVSDGDESYVERAIAAQCNEKERCPLNLLANDPMFEYVFDNLDPDAQLEFSDVREPLQTAKLRQKINNSRIQRRPEQGGPQHKKVRFGRFARQGRAGAPAPPSAPATPIPQAPPPTEPEPQAEQPHRERRSMPFGRNKRFLISDKYSKGCLVAVHAICKLHTVDGEDCCNKTVNLGASFTVGAATRRIKKWCIDGAAISNEVGGRAAHMSMNPRLYADGDVPCERALTIHADAVP